MSNPYPSPPRRLMRDPDKKLIGGVCSGLAKYLNMDVTLVRILTVAITLFTGVPIVLYLIALFVMPEEVTTPNQPPYVHGPQSHDPGFAGPQAYGQPAQPPTDQIWGPAGAPWEQPQPARPSAYDTAPAAPEPTRTFPEPPAEPTGASATPEPPSEDAAGDRTSGPDPSAKA